MFVQAYPDGAASGHDPYQHRRSLRMSVTANLTGRWSGVYFYPVDPVFNPDDTMPATPFVAELTDHGGQVTGTVAEPDNLYGDGACTIPSVIDGSHDESHLRFTKFSEAAEGYEEPIQYEGAIAPDGLSIQGRWSIPGDWSGNFRMERLPDVSLQARAKSGATVSI